MKKNLKFLFAVIFISVFFASFSTGGARAVDKREIGSLKSVSGAIKYDAQGESGYNDLTAEEALKLKLNSGDKVLA